MWSLGGWGVRVGEGGETEASKPPTFHALHSWPLSFFPWFSPFPTNYFSPPKADQRFCLSFIRGQMFQKNPAMAEAELASGKGTVSLFEIRISKGRG